MPASVGVNEHWPDTQFFLVTIELVQCFIIAEIHCESVWIQDVDSMTQAWGHPVWQQHWVNKYTIRPNNHRSLHLSCLDLSECLVCKRPLF